MKTENKKKSQKEIQIKGKMPLSNASGKIWGTFPIPVKNLPHDSGDLLGTSGLAVPFLSGGDCVRLCRGRVPDPAQPPAQGPQP